MISRIEGLVAAPHTPMHSDGQLNLSMIPAQAQFLHRNGVIGAFIAGTTGEGLSLSMDERMALTEAWMAAAPKSMRVIVHVGATAVTDSRTLAAHAQKHSAAAVAMIAPTFFKPANAVELANCCAEVAAASPKLPFYYYHIPSMTGVAIPVTDFLVAAAPRIANLAGVKFTYENLMDLQSALAFDNGRFDILFGRDEIFLAGLALGARGAVGSTYNFAAPLYHNIIKAFNRGDWAEARRLQNQSVDMIYALINCGLNGVTSGKACMSLVGIECGPPRLPLTPASTAQIQQLSTRLASLGFHSFASK